VSEPIVLKNGKYEFQEHNCLLFCKRYGKPWRGFAGDKAVTALFQYALALQAVVANSLCDCDYTFPGVDANNPDVHRENCKFRIKIEELRND
jgi:hypothetical protein